MMDFAIEKGVKMELLSKAEMMEWFKCGSTTFATKILTIRDFPQPLKVGRTKLWDKAEVEEWLEEQKTKRRKLEKN
jgi:predicted DNA-binding transcriptional regulator AlpA